MPKITDLTPEERTKLRLESLEKREKLFQKFIEENPFGLKSFFMRLPKNIQWGWYKTFKGECSRTDAIKQKCLDCSVYSKDEITNCIIHSCPLYQYRPYRKK